jgi:hypothetical protein
MRSTLYFVVLCISLGLQSCVSRPSGVIVERSLESPQQHVIKKMVSIDPNFMVVDVRKSAESAYLRSDQFEDNLNELLIKNAARFNIDMKLIDSDKLGSNSLHYFNDLMPLRQQVMHANFTQTIPYDEKASQGKGNGNAFKVDVNYFEQAPLINSAYSHLSATFGTPYFAVHGVYSQIEAHGIRDYVLLFVLPPLGIVELIRQSSTTYFYSIVINVETGETIYREIREADSRAGKDNLDAMIYDSFSILTKR